MHPPIHDRRERDARDRGGVVGLLDDLRAPQLALPRDLGVGERRPQQHVRQEVERRLEPALRDVEGHGRDVQARTGAELCAQERHLVRDLQRTAPTGALLQHRGGERRESRQVRRIPYRPRVQHDLQVHDGDLVHFHHLKLQAVRKRGRLQRGEFERRGWGERGRLGAINLGGQPDRRTGGQECRYCDGQADCKTGGLADGETGGRSARRPHGVAANSGFPCGTTLSTTR